jgi:hypothetical protein
MHKNLESPVSSQTVKTEPTLSGAIKILKSQDTKLIAISTKLSVNENKTDVITTKLEELTSDIANLRKENCDLKTQTKS